MSGKLSSLDKRYFGDRETVFFNNKMTLKGRSHVPLKKQFLTKTILGNETNKFYLNDKNIYILAKIINKNTTAANCQTTYQKGQLILKYSR